MTSCHMLSVTRRLHINRSREGGKLVTSMVCQWRNHATVPRPDVAFVRITNTFYFRIHGRHIKSFYTVNLREFLRPEQLVCKQANG